LAHFHLPQTRLRQVKTALSASIPQKPQAAFCGISASIACAMIKIKHFLVIP
jgi:hypothetical protein